jgi:hypothetical protein
MRTITHTCTHCGERDQIERSLMLKCSRCRARPGEACKDLRPLVPVAVNRPHPERIQAVREIDEAARQPLRVSA